MPPRTSKHLICACLGLLLPLAARAADASSDFMSMSLEELMNVEVISASRYGQRLADVPAPIYVITQEDIQRSGARSIPEAIRLAPGVDMAQFNQDRWAGSLRSHTDILSNKFLMLVDGRSLYNPTFSGIFWNILQIPVDNIQRIEIIRGPGGANWGFNALNGIINVITRHGSSYSGTHLKLGFGDHFGPVSTVQFGQQFGPESWLSAHLQTDKGKSGLSVDRDASAQDHFRHLNAGLRFDHKDGPRNFMLSAGAYQLYSNGLYNNSSSSAYRTPEYFLDYFTGFNLHARYQETVDSQSEYSLNLSILQNRFDGGSLAQENQAGIDFELQHTIRYSQRHTLIWGASYQGYEDSIRPGTLVAFTNNKETMDILSFFAQDELPLSDELRLTLGGRIDNQRHNASAFQPSIRLHWSPAPNQNVWAAASQARHFPSRLEREAIYSTPFYPAQSDQGYPYRFTTYGAKTIRTEKLTALELGYRHQLTPDLLVDLATYAHHYNSLRTQTQAGSVQVIDGSYLDIPLQSINQAELRTRGLELASEWRPRESWRLQLSYSLTHTGPLRNGDISSQSYYPNQIISLRTSWTPQPRIQLDAWLRHVDSRRNAEAVLVPAYNTLDLRAAWQLRNKTELSIVGQNLLQANHTEFFPTTPSLVASQVHRSIMGYLKLSY